MKLGISVKIDVSKIDKSRLYKGQKGTYLDLTTFINTDELDQYENNGFISQTMTKEERDNGVEKTPILGNVKIFFNDSEQTSQTTHKINKPDAKESFLDSEEIPF